MIDYSKYKFTYKEMIIYVPIIAAIILIIGKIFYGSYISSVIVSPLAIVLYRKIKQHLITKRKKKLKRQFKDAVISMADLISTGYSIENAVKESAKEIETIYGKNSYIYIELIEIIRKLELNMPIEECFLAFAGRTYITEINMFSQTFYIAKRMGGNTIALMKMVAESLQSNINTEEEIDISLSERKLEQKIMCLVPLVIIAYVTTTSPGFFDVMYHSDLGRIVMTVCLGIYVFACYLADNISQKLVSE